MLSSSFLASTLPFSAASSSANFSASLIILSMSSGLSLLLSLVMVIFSLFPVPLSSALTTMMPLASISKVTSIWGTPLGAGGMPVMSNLPSRWLSLVMGLSPSYTWMVTVFWLSAAVEKIWLLTKDNHGVVVLGHGPLSLVHLDGHGVLVVGSGGEDLALDQGQPRRGCPWSWASLPRTPGWSRCSGCRQR